MTWPLRRRRAPGWYAQRPVTIEITVDTTEPPRLLMWVYVERSDGVREWIGGTSENEVTFTGSCRVLFGMQSATKPTMVPP